MSALCQKHTLRTAENVVIRSRAAEDGLRNSEAERAWHSCVSIYAL